MSSPDTELPRDAMAQGVGWRRQPERGSRTLIALMAAVSLRLGRPFGRLLLYGVGVYYFLFAPTARLYMRQYLWRALGRTPRARDRLRLVMSFASTILDRLYLLAGRYQLFDVTLEGEDSIRAVVDTGGAFLMGAHMGSFEVLRVIGRRKSGFAVAMAMYEDNARKLNVILAAAAAEEPPEIIAVGHLNSMLRIHERLQQGVLVGVLADRLFGHEPSLPVTFLGATAHFPTSPMRVAAMLKRRVVFMLGLYRGGNRYHVVFEPLADFSATLPGQRQAAIEAAVTRYAALLERYCRSDPYNWFNFFDFWRTGTSSGPPPGAAGSPPMSGSQTPVARGGPNWRASLLQGTASLCAALLLGSADRPSGAAAAPQAAAPVAAADAVTADDSELARLMLLLAQRRHAEADFQQRQYLTVLTQPLISSGTLIYDAPDHLEQRTVRPRSQSMLLDHGMLTMQIGKRARTVRLADYPQLAPLIDSIRATLAGDRTALERLFKLQFSGTLEHWQLQLEPRAGQLAATLKTIEIQGAGAAISEVQVRQNDGDRSVMHIQPRE